MHLDSGSKIRCEIVESAATTRIARMGPRLDRNRVFPIDGSAISGRPMNQRRVPLTAVLGVAVIAITAVYWLDRGPESSGPATSGPAIGIAAPESPRTNQVVANVEPHGMVPTQPVARSWIASPILASVQAASVGGIYDVVINLDAHVQVGRTAVALDQGQT